MAWRTADELVLLASEMEQSSEVLERRKKIDRRAQLYHLDWYYRPPQGVLRAVDTAPRYVGDRAEDKLCAQEYTLKCRSEYEQMLVDWAMENIMQAADPAVYRQKSEDLKKLARERSDKVEADARGLVAAIEAQQEVDITRALAHGAAVYGFAGPLRMGYDPASEAEAGVVPLYVQFLDPRAVLVKPGTTAGKGPVLLIYKRTATYEQLRYEGWEIDEPFKPIEPGEVRPNTQLTVYDCWEKVRRNKGSKKKPKYELEIWHAIVLEGGNKERQFLQEPINKAVGGCTRIPYVCVPVRPSPFLHESYPGDTSTSFLDAFDENWELNNLTLSFQAQMMQLAVNPAILQKTEDPTEIDVVTPGAQNQIRPNEDAEIMENPHARQDIRAMLEILEAKTQKSTFTGPSFGEGNTQTSGLQTARLQQSSEEGLGATRSAVEQALEQMYNLLAMFSNAYLSDKSYVVPGAPGLASMVQGSAFRGSEIFEVRLPGLSRFEQAQMAATWKNLAQAAPDGSRFLSYESARELSMVGQQEHVESKRIKAEQFSDLVLEQERAARVARATQREENVKDMITAARGQVLAMQAQQQAQAQMTQQLGLPGQQPGQPQPPGVAATPMPAGPGDTGEEDWLFEPPVRGA